MALEDTPTNVAGLTFTNTAAFTYDQLDDDESTRRPGDPGTTEPMTVVEPELVVTTQGPLLMRPGNPGAFTVDVHNAGGAAAHAVYLRDLLPDTADGGTCDAAPVNVTAQIFAADGATPAGPALVDGTDYLLSFAPAPECANAASSSPQSAPRRSPRHDALEAGRSPTRRSAASRARAGSRGAPDRCHCFRSIRASVRR